MDGEISRWAFDKKFTSSQRISPQMTNCPIDFMIFFSYALKQIFVKICLVKMEKSQLI